jgi:hypothetical protein
MGRAYQNRKDSMAKTSDATYTESVDIESRIETLGDLADIDVSGSS